MNRSWLVRSSLAAILLTASVAALPPAKAQVGANNLAGVVLGQATLADYRRATTQRPKDPDAWYNLGVALYNEAIKSPAVGRGSAELTEAIAAYSKALEFRANFYDARLNRGLAYLVQGGFDNSIADLTAAITARKTGIDAYAARAQARAAKKDYTGAVEDYNAYLTAKPDADIALFYARALALYNKGDYAKALPDLDKYLARTPADTDAVYTRALANSALKNSAAAVRDFTTVISAAKPSDPTLPAALLSRAAANYEAKAWDASIADYQRFVTLRPNGAEVVDANFSIGGAYLNKKDYANAIAFYTKVIAAKPTDFDALKNRGFAYFGRKEYAAAIKDFDAALLLKPDAEITRAKASASGQAATGALTAGNFDVAIGQYTQALAANPKDDVALYNRGYAYASKKPADYDKAVADFSAAIAVKPTEATYLFGRANALFNKGLYKQAIPDYKQVITLKPKDPAFADAYLSLAEAYSQSGDAANAAANYDLYLAGKPTDADALLSRGIALYKANQLDRAQADFSAVITAKPGDVKYANAYYNRGLIHEKKKNYDAAAADFAVTYRLKPDFTQAEYKRGLVLYNSDKPANLDAAIAAFTAVAPKMAADSGPLLNRGAAYFKKGEFDKAVTDFSAALKIKPDANAYYSRGVAQFERSEYALAIADYKAALGLNPNLAIAHLEMGRAYDKQGEDKLALAAYQSFVRMEPTSPETSEINKRIAELKASGG